MNMVSVVGNVASELRLLAYGFGPSEFEYANNVSDVPQPEDLFAKGAVPNYTIRAIPVFFLTIAAELFTGLYRGRKTYRVNDFVSSIFLGAVMLVVGLWTKLLKVYAYCYIYENFRVVTLPNDSLTVWLILFLGIDLGYYWMHRTAHTYHILWAAHSVHHSGEDYNLATALRQGALQGATSWVFYLPLALFANPACYAGHAMLNTLGQFWIHTKEIGDCGILEYVLNTPSHHRMHHRPPGNCNYAAILIIWDRMFGTFRSEKEQQDYYGLAKQYDTFDPVWANFEHITRIVCNKANAGFADLFKRRVKHKLVFEPLSVFKPLPPPVRSRWHVPKEPKRTKLDPELPAGWFVYCVVHFLVTLVIALVVLMEERSLTKIQLACLSFMLLFSFSSVGRILDGAEQMSIIMETFRILSFFAVIQFDVVVESNAILKNIAVLSLGLLAIVLILSDRGVPAQKCD